MIKELMFLHKIYTNNGYYKEENIKHIKNIKAIFKEIDKEIDKDSGINYTYNSDFNLFGILPEISELKSELHETKGSVEIYKVNFKLEFSSKLYRKSQNVNNIECEIGGIKVNYDTFKKHIFTETTQFRPNNVTDVVGMIDIADIKFKMFKDAISVINNKDGLSHVFFNTKSDNIIATNNHQLISLFNLSIIKKDFTLPISKFLNAIKNLPKNAKYVYVASSQNMEYVEFIIKDKGFNKLETRIIDNKDIYFQATNMLEFNEPTKLFKNLSSENEITEYTCNIDFKKDLKPVLKSLKNVMKKGILAEISNINNNGFNIKMNDDSEVFETKFRDIKNPNMWQQSKPFGISKIDLKIMDKLTKYKGLFSFNITKDTIQTYSSYGYVTIISMKIDL